MDRLEIVPYGGPDVLSSGKSTTLLQLLRDEDFPEFEEDADGRIVATLRFHAMVHLRAAGAPTPALKQ